MTLSTNNIAIFHDFKLYIEGEECPFESASVSYGIGMIPSALINVAPYREIGDLGERTKIQLYFSDPVNGDMRLLFDGELSGVGITKTPSSYTITFNALHVSNYLNEVLMYFIDPYSLDLYNMPYVASSAATIALSPHIASAKILEQVFNRDNITSKDGKESSSVILAKTFHDIFKSFCKNYIFAKSNGTLNYFKGRFEKWKVIDRNVEMPDAYTNDNISPEILNLERFLESENLMHMLSRAAARIDGFHSIFEVFSYVFSQLLYELLVIPNPYLSKDRGLGVMQSVMYKPQTLFVMPPQCNVIWPSMYEVLSLSKNFKQIPTRLYARLDPMRTVSIDENVDSSFEFLINYVWSPEALNDLKPSEQDKSSTDSERDKIAQRFLDALLPSEEITGPRMSQPQDNSLYAGYLEWLGNTAEDKAIMQNMLDYELLRQQYETSTTDINMVFNPYIVPGFPCLILDKPESGIHWYGYVYAVTHSFGAAGGSRTTARVGYMRPYQNAESIKFPVVDNVWLDIETAYNGLLGINSVPYAQYSDGMTDKDRSDATKIPQFLEKYLRETKYPDYINNAYVRSFRPIITKDEYDIFLPEDVIEYDVGTQELIKKYRGLVNKKIAVS